MTYNENVGERVNLLEWQLLDTSRLEEYQNFVSGAAEAKNERTVNNVRYMMALADGHNQNKAENQYMMIGGMAVLGNISRYLGEYCALNWRDSHDLDVVCRNRGYEFIYHQFFDNIEIATKSLSFGNKLVFRGYSLDINDVQLEDTNIDVYVPASSHGTNIIVNETIFGSDQWKESKVVDYFGIPIRIVDPITLISMKLDVNWGEKTLRKSKDLGDIINLLGVAEKDDSSPLLVCNRLTNVEAKKLALILREMRELSDETYFYKYLLKPSHEYLDTIVILGDER